MTINEIKEKKRELGYSIKQLAELSGIPVGTLQKVLSGATAAPRRETVVKLERALKKETPAFELQEEAAQYGGLMYGAIPEKEPGSYTLEDYLALPDERRVELIDGVIYDMSAPKGYHQLIAGELYALLLAYIRSKKGKCLPFISPIDVQLDCDDRTVVQPDVIM